MRRTEGFALLVGPLERRERRRWFPLAGRIPEGLLGQGGRHVPWRLLVELPPTGLVAGIALTAEGFNRWDPAKRRRHLLRLGEELGERGIRLVGLGRGFPPGPEGAGPVRDAFREVLGAETWLVERWAGRLAGGVMAAEALAATRRWDCERVEVVVAGAETAEGRVAARLLARRFARLTLLGDSPAVLRLAGQILHETGTAARTGSSWERAFRRADLLALAGAPPHDTPWAALRPEAVVVDLSVTTALFAWPGGTPSAALPGLVWAPGAFSAEPLVAAEVAAVAALGAGAGAGKGGDGGEGRLVAACEPSVGGADAVRRAMDRAGFRPAALLDKAGAVLL